MRLIWFNQAATSGSSQPFRNAAVAMATVLALWPADSDAFAYRTQPPQVAAILATNGDQPPVQGPSLSTRFATIACWPLDLEPRLGPPNNQRVKIAPLTLVYGNQPPSVGTSIPTFYETVVGAWPIDVGPQLHQKNFTQVNVAPLTLTYGDQPPKSGPLGGSNDVVDLSVLQQWPPESWSAQGPVKSLAWFVPPIVSTFPYVPFPYAQIVGSWPLDLEPRLHGSLANPQKIAPLTLTYGDQPPRSGPLGGSSDVADFAAIQSWPIEAWAAQRSPQIVPLTLTYGDQPTPQGPISVPEFGIIASWPVDSWAAQRSPQIVPLTLTYGDQPPRSGPLSGSNDVAEFQALLTSWPLEAWAAQRPVQSLAWSVPPIPPVFPYVPTPYGLILASWPSDLEPRLGPPNNRQQSIAPLLLTYGQQPIPNGPISVQELQIIASWPADLEPRLGFPNNKRVSVAPLTLKYGQQVIRGRITQTIIDEILAIWNVPFVAVPQGHAYNHPSFAIIGHTTRIVGIDTIIAAISAGLDIYRSSASGLDRRTDATVGLDEHPTPSAGLDDVR